VVDAARRTSRAGKSLWRVWLYLQLHEITPSLTVSLSLLVCFTNQRVRAYGSRETASGDDRRRACGASAHESTIGEGERRRRRDPETTSGRAMAGRMRARGWRLEGGLRSDRADVNVTYFLRQIGPIRLSYWAATGAAAPDADPPLPTHTSQRLKRRSQSPGEVKGATSRSQGHKQWRKPRQLRWDPDAIVHIARAHLYASLWSRFRSVTEQIVIYHIVMTPLRKIFWECTR
jgi:hypothetical protein